MTRRGFCTLCLIDTARFSAHSTREASMPIANWSTFYFRPSTLLCHDMLECWDPQILFLHSLALIAFMHNRKKLVESTVFFFLGIYLASVLNSPLVVCLARHSNVLQWSRNWGLGAGGATGPPNTARRGA